MPDPDSILEPAKTKHGAEIVVPFEELFFTLKNGEAVRNLAHKPCNIMGLMICLRKGNFKIPTQQLHSPYI